MPRLLALMLCAVALVLGSGMAEARPKTDPKLAREARKHLKAGLKHYQKGKHDKAIESLQVAYSLDPVPVVLFHIAEAHNSKKEYKEALYYYRQYKKEDPKGAKKRGVDPIIEALAEMEDSAPPAEKPAPPATEPAPPPAEAATPEAAPAGDPPPAIESTSDLGASPAPEGDGGGKLRLAAYITAGAGAVLLGAGGYFAWVANQRSDELSELFAEEGQWSDEYQDKWDQGESARTNAIWLTAAGGAAVATGAVLYLLGRRQSRAVELGAGPTTGGGQVTARWEF